MADAIAIVVPRRITENDVTKRVTRELRPILGKRGRPIALTSVQPTRTTGMTLEDQLATLAELMSLHAGRHQALEAAFMGSLNAAANGLPVGPAVQEALERSYSVLLGNSRNPAHMAAFEEARLAILEMARVVPNAAQKTGDHAV